MYFPSEKKQQIKDDFDVKQLTGKSGKKSEVPYIR